MEVAGSVGVSDLAVYVTIEALQHRALPHRGTTISAQTLIMTRYQPGRYAALVKYGSKNGEFLRA